MNNLEGSWGSLGNDASESLNDQTEQIDIVTQETKSDDNSDVIKELEQVGTKIGDDYTSSTYEEVISESEASSKPNLIKRIGAKAKSLALTAVEKIGEVSQEVVKKARQAIETIKSNPKTAFRASISVALIAATAIATTACSNGEDNNSANNVGDGLGDVDGTEAVEVYSGTIPSQQDFENMFRPQEILSGYESLEEIDGSFEQDNNTGCYESKNKVSPASVGNPDEVLQKMGIDPKKATAEERGKAIEYIGLSMKYPTAAEAIAYANAGFTEFSEFKGLTNVEAEDKIASMSDKEKATLRSNIESKNENATYRIIKGNDEIFKNQGVVQGENGRYSKFFESQLGNDVEIVEKSVKGDDDTKVVMFYKSDCANILTFLVVTFPSGQEVYFEIPQKEVEEEPTNSPDSKNQKKADENSGASADIVKPERQKRPNTNEPVPDEAHKYDFETNTYTYSSGEQADNIGYEVTYDARESDTGGGTASGAGQANDFDGAATVSTGEVTGDAPSASGNGTIQESLNDATGNAWANPNNDYSTGY